jgi:Imelysin
MPKTLLAALLIAILAVAGCGSDDESEPAASGTPQAEAAGEDLGAIKDFLLAHSEALADSTADLAQQGEGYRALAESAGFDYAALVESKRDEVRAAIEGMQETWRAANPQYEEMEGVVAGVPELSEFDVIIDAGSDASDPESAVPFDVELPGGKVLEQPGNFFFLTETSLFGTNPAFQAKGVEPDLDGDGTVAFGEAVPDADMVLAFTRDFAAQAKELDAAARAWAPARADALQALVTMTPTMSEYFGQWKNSRFIAGAKADEQSFAASSRLQDIEDILSGLVLIYQNVKPAIAEVDPAQADQTGRDLVGLRDFAADLRAKEEAGTKFDAEQADTLGGEAQGRAEAIAGQVSQAAAQLGIELES